MYVLATSYANVALATSFFFNLAFFFLEQHSKTNSTYLASNSCHPDIRIPKSSESHTVETARKTSSSCIDEIFR
ncbi:unnamed protein product [Sphacelaria rigidula]